ncbi:hypothetical protein, partial [Thermogemmatispora sp.]|uniref:hypothetical protein n=1 Tax=Thermogemmatispora sp. TaxID=1968838 RepID=UPI002ACC0C91
CPYSFSCNKGFAMLFSSGQGIMPFFCSTPLFSGKSLRAGFIPTRDNLRQRPRSSFAAALELLLSSLH